MILESPNRLLSNCEVHIREYWLYRSHLNNRNHPPTTKKPLLPLAKQTMLKSVWKVQRERLLAIDVS